MPQKRKLGTVQYSISSSFSSLSLRLAYFNNLSGPFFTCKKICTLVFLLRNIYHLPIQIVYNILFYISRIIFSLFLGIPADNQKEFDDVSSGKPNYFPEVFVALLTFKLGLFEQIQDIPSYFFFYGCSLM